MSFFARSRGSSFSPRQSTLAVVRAARPFARVAGCQTIVGRSRSRGDPTAERFTRSEVIRIVDAAFSRFEPLKAGQARGVDPRRPL